VTRTGAGLYTLSRIWGSEGDEYEDGCLLGCSALYVMSIAPIMEAVSTSETLVNSYNSTRRYNSEDCYLRTHCPREKCIVVA
jgi:hypothetical protein